MRSRILTYAVATFLMACNSTVKVADAPGADGLVAGSEDASVHGGGSSAAHGSDGGADADANPSGTFHVSGQDAYVKPSDPHELMGFGDQVAASGDTLAVGTMDGYVYVFVRTNEKWSQQARISGALNSLALEGDTLVVGLGDDVSLHGTVKVYSRTGTTWTKTADINASTPRIGARFGDAVALSGDRLAVSAPTERTDGPSGTDPSGAIYIFKRTGTTWSEESRVEPASHADFFGQAIALDGDTLVGGSNLDDSNATGINGDPNDKSAKRSGAAYVFTRNGTTWTQQAYVKASNTRAKASFGETVALSGDTLAVGSPAESSAATGINGDESDASGSSGAVYVFTRSGTTWTQQAYVKPSTNILDLPDNYPMVFGGSIAVSGDELVVGAYGEQGGARGINGDENDLSGGAKAGAAYAFKRTGTTWKQEAYIKASNTVPKSQLALYQEFSFGWRVALTPSMLVVTAPGETSDTPGINNPQPNTHLRSAGAAYVFR